MLLVLLLIPGQVTLIDVGTLSTGDYILHVQSDGQVSVKAVNIIRLNTTPTDLSPRAIAIRDAVTDKIEAKKLAIAFQKIKELVDDGTLKNQQDIAIVIKKTSEIVLGGKPSKVMDIFAAEWARMVQDGVDFNEYGKYLGEVVEGLSISNEAIDPAWIELIMKIILLIIQLLGV